MIGGASTANDYPVLLVTKQVDDLLMQLHKLEAQLELMEQAAMLMPASATTQEQDVELLLTKSEVQPNGKLEHPYIAVVAAASLHPHSELPLEIESENIQLLPANSECQPNREREQQDIGLVAAIPLHPHSDLPLEIKSENVTEVLDKELVTKTAFEARQFDQYSSGMLLEVMLRDEALSALSTMPATGLLRIESMNSPVLRGGRNHKDDLAMKRVVLADDVPAVRSQHVQELPMAHPEMSLADEVVVKVSQKWRASQAPAVNIQRTLTHEIIPAERTLKDEAAHALPLVNVLVKLSRKRRASQAPTVNVERTLTHEIIPAERTLKDEAAHALPLVNDSSVQHRATLPSLEWQTASMCAYRSSTSNDVKCPSMHNPILSAERSTATASSAGPHSKDSLGSPC
eukprot:CAMPEP_0172785264 /NCGR_PEP_ID=MMETSP1074-20121228/205354_1 /TAXON_ID=2916 /ORGANISM="Ceratium fusus, Strain PA161109" /LENGTH=401 /DNA_ID=CAMNT_0013622267 /DNA_START=30 /DNA_END=1232 /DNA_ORIENTATION=+